MPKFLAVFAQAGLAAFAWYMTRTDDERRALQASAWKAIEDFAMGMAKNSSNLAAWAERHYRETVSV
jgi:hypothetical protein